MTEVSKPHSDRLADIRLKWVQTYNATTDNEPRTAAMRGDIRWLVEQLEVMREALTLIADYGHEMDDYVLPPKQARRIAREALNPAKERL